MPYVDKQKLYYQDFLRRENNTRHHRYDEELILYDRVKSGNMEEIESSVRMFTSDLPGHLSDDPIRNYKYMFVASTTLTTRFSIEGGMDEEEAYTASDLYIQRMDSCEDVNSIVVLYRDMLTYFTNSMNLLRKKSVFSKPVIQCMDYIYYHLHEKITVKLLAEYVNLHPNYLSGLFKRETGQTISDYIAGRRMQAAKNMLLYSDTSCAEISSILAFSSQSYFTKQFHSIYGFTPNEYRKRFFRSGFNAGDKSEKNQPDKSADR